ncbi:hypothetical protein NW759_017304 [Fusarium solani]|nr:hypothetical protein NW759_017304 [Fusarium solani]
MTIPIQNFGLWGLLIGLGPLFCYDELHIAPSRTKSRRSVSRNAMAPKRMLDGNPEEAEGSTLVFFLVVPGALLRDAHQQCSDTSPEGSITQQYAVVFDELYSESTCKITAIPGSPTPPTPTCSRAG